MQVRCNNQTYSRVSVYCLEKYLTADDVRDGLKISDRKSAEERINQAFDAVVKMAELHREAGEQFCMAFKQTNHETFFAEIKKRGLSEELVMLIMGEVFCEKLQGVWDAKSKK